MNAIPKRRPEASQRFPFIHLGRAIERARELYKVANGHDVPFPTAAAAWGYAEKSSGGAQTAAALKSFGLLEDVSGGEVRKVKLSEFAMRIIRDPRELSADRDVLVREAALKPPLHREIIDKYSGLPPSDEALKAFLLIDRGLRDEAVPEFLREFVATMALAKISDAPIIQDVAVEVPTGNEGTIAPSKNEVPKMPQGAGASVSLHSQPMPPFPAGVEMNPNAKDQYNLAMYSEPEGSRIRISADLDLKGARKLAKLLES